MSFQRFECEMSTVFYAALVVPGHLLFNMLIAILQGGAVFSFHFLFGILYLSSWYVKQIHVFIVTHCSPALQSDPSGKSPLRVSLPRPLAVEDEGGPRQCSHSVSHGGW